jgi:hypothetical protein
MPDERDALLLREFARCQRPLTDAQFVARVRERLPLFALRRPPGEVLAAALRGIYTGLTFGVVSQLRMGNAAVLVLAALGVALWAILGSSR